MSMDLAPNHMKDRCRLMEMLKDTGTVFGRRNKSRIFVPDSHTCQHHLRFELT